MDVKITRRDAVNSYMIIGNNSDELKLIQFITKDFNNYYNSGVYGWNFSVATIGEVNIINSYRGTPAGAKLLRTMKATSKLFKNTLDHFYSLNWREQDKYINRLRGTFYDRLIKAIKKDLGE